MAKAKKKTTRLSITTKLVLVAVSLFAFGSLYQLFSYGSGPLAPFFSSGNTINLVNGLDPEEAEFMKKAVNRNARDADNAPAIKFVVKNAHTEEVQSANVKIERGEPISDGLEAEEAAFIQNAITIDKAVNGGGTGVVATAPTVKVTVTNPQTGAAETAMVKLTNNPSANVATLTKAIETHVISANKNVNLSKNNHFCRDGNRWISVGSQTPYGTDNLCRTCSLVKEKDQNKYNANLTTSTSTCAPAFQTGQPTCTIYAQPASLNKNSRRIVYSMDQVGPYTEPVTIFATDKNYTMTIKIDGQTYRKKYKCENIGGVGKLK